MSSLITIAVEGFTVRLMFLLKTNLSMMEWRTVILLLDIIKRPSLAAGPGLDSATTFSVVKWLRVFTHAALINTHNQPGQVAPDRPISVQWFLF